MKKSSPPETPSDPLKFRDIKRYVDRLKENRAKTGANDAVTLAFGKLEGQGVTVAVQDFAFQGGTLGMAAGETIVAGMDAAVERRTPFMIFTASGGADAGRDVRADANAAHHGRRPAPPRTRGSPYIVVLPIQRPAA